MDYGHKKTSYWTDSKRGRSGIIKKQIEENEELLCFGYSCKLFRDDEKAVYIDKEDHLIPWMGDTNLMIDRFDVRGALYDLHDAESKGEPFEETATKVELKEEEICEQERYKSLYHDDNELKMLEEEESKRLHYELYTDESQYGQVGLNYTEYTYDQAAYQVPPEPVTYNPTNDDDLFTPPPELSVPIGMEVPPTIKQNKVIMKTAKFIVQHGAQMEIVIKTKQAGNPMFNFLVFDNPLSPFYKHAVHMIRNGRYRWDEEPAENKATDAADSYQNVRPDLTPGVIASPRPSPHCAYSKLITKIKEKQKGFDETEIASPIAPSSPALHEIASNSECPAPPVLNKPYHSTPKATPGVPVSIIQQPSSTGTPQMPKIGLVDYPSFNQTADGSSDMEDSEPSFVKNCLRNQMHDYSNIKWPPPEMQMVIDKMASYIIKNGSAFEEIVKSRRDSRFDFLRKNHSYFPYYKCKLQLYGEVYGDTFKSKNDKDEDSKNKSITVKKDYSKSGNRAISFSIRNREHDGSVTSHTSFPVESSTSEENEENDSDEREKRKLDRAKRRITRREKEKKEREEFIRKERLRKEKEEEERERMRLEGESSGNEDLYDIFQYAQEMAKDKLSGSSQSPDCSQAKQEVRKKKAAVFLSKLNEKRVKKTTEKPVFGPHMLSDLIPETSLSESQSLTSSSSDEEKQPPLPPPLEKKQAPPLPRSPSPLALETYSNSNKRDLDSTNSNKYTSREVSTSPPIKLLSTADSTLSITELLSGVTSGSRKRTSRTSDLEERSRKRTRTSNSEERSAHKNHKKHMRPRSGSRSRSSSSRRDRKKRKRRKKRRSRSRSRGHSRSHGHSHRSSHKKKQSRPSRHKDKGRKKKHHKHRSPSSTSSLPSSETSSVESPSSLPFESDSDLDVQVIESGEDAKKSSRSSSVISLAFDSTLISTLPPVKKSNGVRKKPSTEENSEENESRKSTSPSNLFPKKFSLLEGKERSANAEPTDENKFKFNATTSNAMAKIAKGLRAKLNAMMEKDNNN